MLTEDRVFLVAVDAHSKWPEVAIMRSATTEKTIEALGEMFWISYTARVWRWTSAGFTGDGHFSAS